MAIEEKRWKKELETPIYTKWQKEQVYAFENKQGKPVFSIDTPPPYVNTPIHIGQATTYVLMDMFARFKRMTGHTVLFPLGLDRNGLPIETAAEKRFNIKLNEVTREEFIEKCHTVLKESSTASLDSFLKLGISFNSWKEGEEPGSLYLTDSEQYRRVTQETFLDLWEKGLIYEDKRINNYCPGCQTTVADSEIEYADLPTKFNDVKFKVKETGADIIIGTTRPELIATCGMVIFNPEDERYQSLEGKTAVTPIFNKEIPIKAHPLAEIDKGTGLVMMCSAGDLSDIRFFREMGLAPVIAINADGKMNEQAGLLNGLKVAEAREKMIEELRNQGLLVQQKPTTHRIPVCERSKDPIEFIAMAEYYLKQLDFREDMNKIAQELNFFAPRSRQILLDWIESLSIDWPISRRRYYATEIPLWYCKGCNAVVVPPKGKYYQPWREKPPVQKCSKCNSTEFRGEERVLDTWFDSSNSPLFILGYIRNPSFFDAHKPCSVRPQGKEIVRTWLYYTLLKGFLLTKERIFQDTWINYHIVDDKGEKMSKSKGNVIDPQEVLEKFGAEPFRLWAATEGNLEKTDFRCSFERIEGSTKTLTKLWNLARFISHFPLKDPKKFQPLPEDQWILNELNELMKYTRERYEQYDFHNPATRIKSFLWNEFASHYLELVKGRAYNNEKEFKKEEQEAAVYTLHYGLDTLLKLLAPIIPLITYYLYDRIRGKDIHREAFPALEVEKSFELPFTSEELMELNSGIWSSKKEQGISLNKELDAFDVPSKFKPMEKTLKSAHRIKKINFT